MINSKITSINNRTKYKKYFRENISDLFAPVFLMSLIIILIFFSKEENTKEGNFAIVFIVLKIVLLIPQILIAKIKFEYVKSDIVKLKTKTEIDVINGLK
jgi:fumarate reductase subunit C